MGTGGLVEPAMLPGGTADLPKLPNRLGIGDKSPFCLSGLLVRMNILNIIVLVSESTFPQKLN